MNAKRILIVGCPGSGKSTFARRLAECTGLKLVHLDMLFWNADKTTVSQEIFIRRLADEMKGDQWIIDGNYASTLRMRLEACDLVYFLDYPLELCLEGIRARRGTKRTDMPWIESEEDGDLISFVRSFSEEVRPHMLALFAEYPQKGCIIFRSRADADDHLRSMIRK